MNNAITKITNADYTEMREALMPRCMRTSSRNCIKVSNHDEVKNPVFNIRESDTERKKGVTFEHDPFKWMASATSKTESLNQKVSVVFTAGQYGLAFTETDNGDIKMTPLHIC